MRYATIALFAAALPSIACAQENPGLQGAQIGTAIYNGFNPDHPLTMPKPDDEILHKLASHLGEGYSPQRAWLMASEEVAGVHEKPEAVYNRVCGNNPAADVLAICNQLRPVISGALAAAGGRDEIDGTPSEPPENSDRNSYQVSSDGKSMIKVRDPGGSTIDDRETSIIEVASERNMPVVPSADTVRPNTENGAENTSYQTAITALTGLLQSRSASVPSAAAPATQKRVTDHYCIQGGRCWNQ